MLDYILVMLGGGLGTGARFWISGFIAERAGEFFPLGTLVVNVTVRSPSDFSLRLRVRKGRFLCRREVGNFS